MIKIVCEAVVYRASFLEIRTGRNVSGMAKWNILKSQNRPMAAEFAEKADQS